MSKKFYGGVMLAIFISISFVACKDKGKSEENVTTDTTKTMTTTDNSTSGMDAVTVAPGLYKVLADTLGIRMVEVVYKPGDSSALHWHPDYAVYAIEGGTATFYAKDGSSMVNEMKQGVTMIRPGEFHSVKNNGKTDIHVLLVEVNRSGPVATGDAALDATKVAPVLYKAVNDTMGIRVIEVNYKPGESSGTHWHPDGALYVIDAGTGEFTAKDGSKSVREMPKGMARVVTSDTHSVKNTGKTTMRAILVEVYRAMK